MDWSLWNFVALLVLGVIALVAIAAAIDQYEEYRQERAMARYRAEADRERRIQHKAERARLEQAARAPRRGDAA